MDCFIFLLTEYSHSSQHLSTHILLETSVCGVSSLSLSRSVFVCVCVCVRVCVWGVCVCVCVRERERERERENACLTKKRFCFTFKCSFRFIITVGSHVCLHHLVQRQQYTDGAPSIRSAQRTLNGTVTCAALAMMMKQRGELAWLAVT